GSHQTLVLCRKARSLVQTTQLALLLLYYKIGRRKKWVRFEGRKRIPQRHHTRPPKGPRRLALPSRRMRRLRDARVCLRERGGQRVVLRGSLEMPVTENQHKCGLRALSPTESSRNALEGLRDGSFPNLGGHIHALISLSFGGAVGLMFLMLGCALPIYNQYWPLFVLFFYILSPIPYCIARRLVDDTDAMSNACKELAIFLTTGIVVSAFGLPIVFARAHLIEWGACALVLTGNTVIFATILGFFLVFGSNDDFSWQQW
ncbi:hypothetical protein E2I00_010929, partial [Balaenoptera physalus]